MNNLLNKSKLFLKRNSSTILTCIGAAGVVLTAVTAAKATPKAMALLRQAEDDKQDKLTKLEKLQVAAPAYIPSVMIGASTIACIFGANVLNKRSQAALTSAYVLLDSSYKEYIERVKDIYGEKAHVRIINNMYENKRENVDIERIDVNGKKEFFDFFSLQIFESTLDEVRAAEQYVNDALRTRGYISLAEFYEQLGIDGTDDDCALGWSAFCCDEFKLTVQINRDDPENEHYLLIMETEPSPNYMYY